MDGTPNVGSRIKTLREQRELSQRGLAEMCGVSPNTVSLIERDLSSPCVDTLQRLATGLAVPITSFFETDDRPAGLILIRSANRKRSRCPGMHIEHLGSGLPDYALASFRITMEPGAATSTTPIEHVGLEWVYVLEGLLAYNIDGKEYELEAGDSLLFDATLPHRWWNPGRRRTCMLLILDAGERHSVTVEQHL